MIGASRRRTWLPGVAGLVVSAVLVAVPIVAAQQGGAARAQAPNLDAVTIRVLPVQRNVSMLVGAGGNITVQTGPDGVILVDTQYEPLAARVAAAVRTLSARPLHTIVNTSLDPDHIGGTGALAKTLGGGPPAVRVMAQANVLLRLQRDAAPSGPVARFSLNPAIVVPVTSTYDTPSRDFFYNGEAVFLHHAPAAHTDGDTIVYFRGSDVLSTGDVFTPDRYPVIDLRNGGSVNGEIAALNQILSIAVPGRYQEGGTYIVPGHGRLCDEADVVEYRDMVTIIRDRVRDLIAKKMTLEQVKAARPTRDYDTVYGSNTGPWTTEMFVEAVYRSLADAKR
jgi:glyoxylase-like metal-dependent hydrolase (beta-lactamase superfamily II)